MNKKTLLTVLIVLSLIFMYVVESNITKQIELPIKIGENSYKSGMVLRFKDEPSLEKKATRELKIFLDDVTMNELKTKDDFFHIKNSEFERPRIKSIFLETYAEAKSYEVLDVITYDRYINAFVRFHFKDKKSIVRHFKMTNTDGGVKLAQVNRDNPINKYIGMFHLTHMKNSDFEIQGGLSTLLDQYIYNDNMLFSGVGLFFKDAGQYTEDKSSELNKEVLVVSKKLGGNAKYYISSDDIDIVYFDVSSSDYYKKMNKGRSNYLVYFFKTENGYSYDIQFQSQIHDMYFSDSALQQIENKLN